MSHDTRKLFHEMKHAPNQPPAGP
eukprot:COSAG04_NODE_31109_length_258_cov_1.295597_1_plen_23_part_10